MRVYGKCTMCCKFNLLHSVIRKLGLFFPNYVEEFYCDECLLECINADYLCEDNIEKAVYGFNESTKGKIYIQDDDKNHISRFV